MKGFDLFPIDGYYKEHILDAITISRNHLWWTAVLLINDPKSKKKIIRLYKWQNRKGVWKRSSAFTLSSKKNIESLANALDEFKDQIK